MSSPLRPRIVPQCTACLRTYALGASAETSSVARQQIRSKSTKKAVNSSNTAPVRLLKDMKAFGRKGAIVPISHGQMRNEWFPRRVAEYVTMPEQKALRLENVAVERDFDFGVASLAQQASATTGGGIGKSQADIPASGRGGSSEEMVEASMFQKKAVEPKKISPERAVELLELFVKDRLDFYRQPIIEESKAPEPEPEPIKPAKSYGSGIGAELMAARRNKPVPKAPEKPAGPQAIYGSVSAHDVLMAVRAAMKQNDEAAMVVLQEGDIHFTSGANVEDGHQDRIDRVRHVGEYEVEIKPKGSEMGRKVKLVVHAQEAA